MEKQSNGLAIAALVCGICGIVLGWLPVPFVGLVLLVLSILGIVFGIKARKVCPSKGMATAGLVLGIIGTCISALGCALCTCLPLCTACSAIMASM